MAEATQTKTTIAIDPVTRIEGHLKAEVVVENGKVVDAKLTGGMYRGFESILRGRHPRDAAQIVQRICGVCPTAHATAASIALEKASGTAVPSNGRATRNLILGANYLQSHILHFYHLAGQDFIQGPDTAPFMPRYAKPDLRLPPAINAVGVDQYVEALEVRAVCHEMVALFGGRMPHVHGILAGGAAEIPTKEKLVEYAARFKKVRKFVEEKYLPVVYLVGSQYKDLGAFGQGYRNALCVGVFPLDDEGKEFVFKAGAYQDGKDMPFDVKRVTEDVKYSWFADSTSGKPFTKGENVLEVDKKGAYSFVKAPLYNGKPMEVGPLARMWVNNKPISPIGQKLFKEYFGLDVKNFRDMGEDLAFSLLGRHVARAEESYLMLDVVERFLKEVRPDEETFSMPVMKDSEGFGFTEAPRGSLMHFTKVRNGKIDNYQIVSATLWNCAPRNDTGMRGALEEALALAPSATSATALSAAGWALTTLPASVLELRIWLDPTMEEAWARQAASACTGALAAAWLCVTPAPMRIICSRFPICFSSFIFVISTRHSGQCFPSLISSTRSVPPAITLAFPICFCSSPAASSTVCGT